MSLTDIRLFVTLSTMNMQTDRNREHPDPIKERIGEGMFTDREQEMDYLMWWAILERFYNRIFWERDDIVPFYYELKPEPIYIQDFVEDYYLSFLHQFLAYRTKNAAIAFKRSISLDDLYKLAEDAREELVMKGVDRFPELRQRPISLFFGVVRDTPREFAWETDVSTIVMFDEFQRLDQVLYLDEDLQRKCPHYTGSFSSVVENAWAPMLIAGSQMTILTRQALSKGMAGRVGRIYLERMTEEASAELARKLAHAQGIELPLELSYIIAQLTRQHPYYIWSLFNTRRVDGGLHNEQDIKERLKFEIEDDQGYINEFWRENFVDNMDAMNEPDAKKIIFYLMQQPEREVRVDEIVDDLELTIPPDEVNRQLRKLVRGDLIKQIRLGGLYGSIKDAMLERVLRVEYSWELENLKLSDVSTQIELELAQETIVAQTEMIKRMQGELNNWVGRIAEAFIEKLMKAFFTGQTVSGETYFHHPHEIKLSRFKRVYTTFAQPFGATRPYQIDIYAQPENEDELPWIVESKNWQNPVDRPTVEHFLKAAKNLAADQGHSQTIRWFYARSGFTKPAQTLLDEQGVFYTEQADLVQMLQDFQVVEQWWSE